MLGVYGPRGVDPMTAEVEELRRTRHEVEFRLGALEGAAPALADATAAAEMQGGKLANLNRLAAPGEPGGEHSAGAGGGRRAAGAAQADWVLLIDDDVVLGEHFLDRLVALAENFDLHLVQPALSRTSHTAWPVVRRRADVLRESRFVEMGPIVLMRRQAFATLAPFPEEGMGWGICLHWAAVAKREGWRIGIADAVPARHDLRPPAQSYGRGAAAAAANELLSTREHIGWREADEVLATHRSC